MSWFGSDDEFVGNNPGGAASIDYWLKKRHLFGDLKIEVYDSSGELITTLPGRKRRGLNRVGWPMRLKPPKVPPASSLVPAFQGPRVPEGAYTIKLIKGKEILEGTVELVADPRNPHPKEDRLLQQKTALQVYDLLEDLTFLADSVTDLRDQARERAKGLAKKDKIAVDAFADNLDALHKTVVAIDDGGRLSGKEELRERLGALYGDVSGYDGRPSESQLQRMAQLQTKLEAKTREFEAAADGIDDLNKILGKRDLEPLHRLTLEEWQVRQGGAGGSGALAVVVADVLSGLF